jgi:hypothetical protein
MSHNDTHSVDFEAVIPAFRSWHCDNREDTELRRTGDEDSKGEEEAWDGNTVR